MKAVVSHIFLFTAIALFAAYERDSSPQPLDPETAKKEPVDFDNVTDLQTAQAASIIPGNATYVNCPVATIQ